MSKGGPYDPALMPEARMERMREEMYFLRRTIIDLLAERVRAIVDPPYDISQDESQRWLTNTAHNVIQAVEPDLRGKAICPLCGGVPQFAGIGYSYPIGLERHLVGSHRSSMCPVMHAADGLRRVRHRKLYPGDYGPYGCD